MTRKHDFTKKMLGASLALGLVAAPALAQEIGDPDREAGLGREAAEAGERKISFSGGVDYNTHFISYGFDVWGVGNDFGKDATLNPWAEVVADFDWFTVVVGTWMDINSNVTSPIGGQFQEIDAYYGVGFSYDNFSFGVTYQDWVYGGGVEKILDISAGYDDSGLWGDSGFALNPSVLWHKRLGATNLTSDNGSVLVLGIEPGFTLIDSETYPIDLSIPVSAGFFLDDGYHGLQANGNVTQDGFGYISVGGTLSMPLTFVPAEYGDWALGANLTWYYTENDVINNPDDSFLTGTIGVSVSF